MKSRVDAWTAAASGYSSDAEKLKSLHDSVALNVEYNYDFIDLPASEQNKAEDTLYTQSAYSVFCTDLTVCAGYAQALEMLCNGMGIDCVAVTSYNHEWNKVRINDSWYNVDVTWNDAGGDKVYYAYYGRSDDYYDSDSPGNAASHAEEGLWDGYLPPCTLDTGSSDKAVGTWPTISARTAQPTVDVDFIDYEFKVKMECATPGATIYYTLDGTTPSPAATKSFKYDGPFDAYSYDEIKAVAVKDGQLDSNVSKGISVIFKVKFNGNGSTSGSMKNQSMVYGSGTKLTANAFKKKGYTFTGWNTKADGSGKDCANKADGSKLTKTAGKTVTLYAQWKKTKYKINYKLNGGKNNSKNPASYYITTSTITLKNPTRSGYTFKGWYTDSKFKNKVTSVKKGSTGDKTFYAKWAGISYKVKFNGNGSTSGSMKTRSVTYGSGAKLASVGFKKKGYTFTGWNTKANGKGKTYANKADGSKLTTSAGKTVTLYAQWKKTKYKITYKLNDGKNNSKNPKSYYITTSTIKLKNPTRKGYTFKGWYTDSKYKNKITEIQKGSTGNKTLYAKWAKTKYTITYNLNKGKNDSKNPTKYYITTSTIKLKNPTRKGYTFQGWYTDSKYKNKITQIKKGSTGNKTLYAKWKKK